MPITYAIFLSQNQGKNVTENSSISSFNYLFVNYGRHSELLQKVKTKETLRVKLKFSIYFPTN